MLEDEISTYLFQAGIATPATDMFEGRSPDLPDDMVTIRSYPGLPGMKTQEKVGIAYERPSLQITVRSASVYKAMTRSLAIWKALQVIRNQVLSGVWYTHVTPSSSPYLIGFDQNGRVEYGFNAQAEKQPSV